MDSTDVHRVAKFLVQQYGGKAIAHAMENVDWMLAHNDEEAAADWRDILRAIEELQAYEAEPRGSAKTPYSERA